MMCCSEVGGKCNYCGDGSCLAYRATSDTVALMGNWVPKLVPSTVQANINMTGNRAKLLWSLVSRDPRSLGKRLSRQWALAWDPEASHGRGCLGPPLSVDSAPQAPRGLLLEVRPGHWETNGKHSPRTLGLCEQGISNGHNLFLVCHLLECNCIFSGTVLKTMAFLLIFLL